MLPVNLRYAINLLVLGMAVLWFLVTVEYGRLSFLYHMSTILLLPLIGIEGISIVIWLINCQETSFIIRGTVNVVCAISNVLCIASAYYMFGKKTVQYTAWAAMAAMAIVLLDVMRRFGVGQVILEYITLLLTFADDTGKSMEQMELHDLVQGLGVFLMYYLFGIRSNKQNRGLLLMTGFFFSIGLKRIDVMAILAACGLGAFYNVLSERWKTVLLGIMVTSIFAFAYGYLFLIKRGIYQPMMESLGINTMSRDYIYDFYKDFYELTPFFLGFGIRYIFKLRSNYLATGRGIPAQDAPHNEFMTHYIELGFWGFIFWLWSNTWYKIAAVRKKYGSASSTFLVMAIIYSFTTYITDNTFFYYSINIAIYVTVMTYADEHKCRI